MRKRRVGPVAARITAREEGHIPAPLAHRPAFEFVLIDAETVCAHEPNTTRDGEWIESDTVVEVRR